MASGATSDDVRRTEDVSSLCSNLFGDISSRDWHDPFHWWVLKPLADVIGPKLVHAGRRVQRLEHERRNGVYGKKKMTYFVPVLDEDSTYRFEPRDQYTVEQLLVEHWDSILAMLVARRNGADVAFDDDVRDAVLGPCRELLALVDRTRPCGSAAQFAAAVDWLIEAKELPCRTSSNTTSLTSGRAAGPAISRPKCRRIERPGLRGSCASFKAGRATQAPLR
mmetsp:Transcript_31094/g.100192  ORF Transcript_31094/g.100192 Transcript_31094/m.100192 type:complete len:222 (-) Transcript_31094:214-879(-)